jgi:SAM-dependent methyltransferase
MNKSELQRRVDESYPPTMTFNVDTFSPTLVLADRVKIIAREFDGFFRGYRLLDVGCSQGWFALNHAANFSDTVALEPEDEAFEVADAIFAHRGTNEHLRVLHSSFREYWDNARFDRIFLGNTWHHVFREFGDNSWIKKLAALSNGDVLVEGPKDTHCKDFAGRTTVYPPALFNTFCETMSEHFELVKEVPAVRYTPGRHVMLWRRKEPMAHAEREIEKSFRADEHTSSNEVTVFLASTSPVSNGMLRFCDGGWVEELIDDKVWRRGQNDRKIFRLHCKHNEYLARFGYVDLDPGTINFTRKDCLHFDKSGLAPIVTLQDAHVSLYKKLFRQSYKAKADLPLESILHALRSRSVPTAMEAFRCAAASI